MTVKVKDLIGRRLEATDGLVGKVRDLFFDDESWHVRYVVVDTGGWLESREVLISPVSFIGFDQDNGAIMTSLTCNQVKESPPALSDAPVTRLYEQQLHNHYGWPYYWGGTAFGGPGLYLYPPVGDIGVYPALYGRNRNNDNEANREERAALEQRLQDANPHLMSCQDIKGYGIHAQDGQIGHVEDFLLNDGDWRLTHLVVDTRNWIPGRKVLVRTPLVNHIDIGDAEVVVELTRDAIKNAPLESEVSTTPKRTPDLTAGSESLDLF